MSTNVAMSTPSSETMNVRRPYGYGSNRSDGGASAFHAAHAVNAVRWQSTNQRLPAKRLIASLTRADQLLAARAFRSRSMIAWILRAAAPACEVPMRCALQGPYHSWWEDLKWESGDEADGNLALALVARPTQSHRINPHEQGSFLHGTYNAEVPTAR